MMFVLEENRFEEAIAVLHEALVETDASAGQEREAA
jgi:hypothetical protein